MSEKVLQLVTSWEAQGEQGGGTIGIGPVMDDDGMWRVQARLHNGSLWMLAPTEAEEFQKIVQIEVDRVLLRIKNLGHSLSQQAERQRLQADREHLDKVDAMIKMAGERAFEMNVMR